MKSPFKAADLCLLLEKQLNERICCADVLEEAPFKDEGQTMTIQEMLTSINSGHEILFLLPGTEPLVPKLKRGDRVCVSRLYSPPRAATVISHRPNRFDCYSVLVDGQVTKMSLNRSFLDALEDQEVAPICKNCRKVIIQSGSAGRGGCRCGQRVPIDPRELRKLDGLDK